MAETKPQRVTSHQGFLKDQVKNQQDATLAWARRTGKPNPPYQFEDFIGKGAYTRVIQKAKRSMANGSSSRPGYTLRIQQIQQKHQRGQERQNPEYPIIAHQTCSDAPKPQLEHQKRVASLTNAELSEFLREPRLGVPRENPSRDRRKDPLSTMAGTKPQRITSH